MTDPQAKTPQGTANRILCRTVVTKRGKNGEIEEFERYEMPIKPATRSGHRRAIPDPIIE